MRSLEFGVVAQDKISGFVGMITAKTSYITGCDRYFLTPRVDKDGKYVEGKYFDEGTLCVIADGLFPEETRINQVMQIQQEEFLQEEEIKEQGTVVVKQSVRTKEEVDEEQKKIEKELSDAYTIRHPKRDTTMSSMITPSGRGGGPHDNDPTISNGGMK